MLKRADEHDYDRVIPNFAKGVIMSLLRVSRRTLVSFPLLCVIALPCLARAGSVVSSVADCQAVGGFGRWSDPAIWSPMQVPNNGRPAGTTYNVVAPGTGCLGIFLDATVITINQLSMEPLGYWDGAKDKAAKIRADGVVMNVLNNADIDELGMTNGKLTVGGTATVGISDGWFLTDSKFKAGNYHQAGFALASFVRSPIQIDDTFLVADYAWAELERSTLDTQTLELSGVLSLVDGSTVSVGGDFSQLRGELWGLLGIQLGGGAGLSVEGDVYLDGGLFCSLKDGYVPSLGEEFTILRYKGFLNGSWAGVEVPQLPAGLAWSLVFGKQAISLKVVPAV
jgi:hypothetical protein